MSSNNDNTKMDIINPKKYDISNLDRNEVGMLLAAMPANNEKEIKEKEIALEKEKAKTSKTLAFIAVIGGVIVAFITVPNIITVILQYYNENRYIPSYELATPNRQPTTYTDLEYVDWYYEAVNYISSCGITNGTDDGKFHANEYITYQQLTVWLIKSFGIYSANREQKPESFAQCLNVAKELKIIPSKYTSTDKTISRNKAAEMILKALSKIGKSIPDNYEDNIYTGKGKSEKKEINKGANDALIYLAEMGLLHGNGKSLMPKSEMTRGEAAQILYSILKLLYNHENF